MSDGLTFPPRRVAILHVPGLCCDCGNTFVVKCCCFCQLIQANSTHKTQLMELSLLREEEKQTYKRQEENLVSS